MTVSKWSRYVSHLAVTVASLAVASVSLVSSVATAGDGAVGHSHATTPATKDQILDTAAKVKDKLIVDGKVDASWKDIAPETAEEKVFSSKKEWVVTFKNPKVADKAKQSLYLFFSRTGNYLASNHTGK